MHNRFLFLLVLIIISGCGPKVHFIKVGKEYYPPKPDDYEVPVFLNDQQPEEDYKVVGMVFVETEPDNMLSSEISDSELINKLKKEARERGADAIIDLKITSGAEALPDGFISVEYKKLKRVQAKLIVFINNN